MFSDMLAVLQSNRLPDSGTLQKRFDFAMTKKLGILKLPPAYWMQDPKINPRTEDLFWASLLLKDRERIDLALFVMSAEQAASSRGGREGYRLETDEHAQKLVEELLLQFSDIEIRNQLRQDLSIIVPEMLKSRV